MKSQPRIATAQAGQVRAEVEPAAAEERLGRGPRRPDRRDGERGARDRGHGETAVDLPGQGRGRPLLRRHRGRLAQPGELLLDLADVVGNGLRVRQPAVAHPPAYDVTDGREQGRGGAGGEQRPAVLPPAGSDRVEHLPGEVRRDEAPGAHGQARQGVGGLVVAGPRARRDGVGPLPGVLRADRGEVRRDRQDGQIDLHDRQPARRIAPIATAVRGRRLHGQDRRGRRQSHGVPVSAHEFPGHVEPRDPAEAAPVVDVAVVPAPACGRASGAPTTAAARRRGASSRRRRSRPAPTPPRRPTRRGGR